MLSGPMKRRVSTAGSSDSVMPVSFTWLTTVSFIARLTAVLSIPARLRRLRNFLSKRKYSPRMPSNSLASPTLLSSLTLRWWDAWRRKSCWRAPRNRSESACR